MASQRAENGTQSVNVQQVSTGVVDLTVEGSCSVVPVHGDTGFAAGSYVDLTGDVPAAQTRGCGATASPPLRLSGDGPGLRGKRQATHSRGAMALNDVERDRDWQFECVPRLRALLPVNPRLSAAIKSYRRDRLAQELGWSVADNLIAPMGHWQDIDNCAARAKAMMDAAPEFRSTPTGMPPPPPMDWFKERWPSLVVVFRLGFRWADFMRMCGRDPLRNAAGSWIREEVDMRVAAFEEAEGPPGLMPLQDVLEAASCDNTRPGHRAAKGLAVQICRIGGGWAAVAGRLQLKLQGAVHVTNEEREILYRVLEQNIAAKWDDIETIYNDSVTPRGLPKRTGTALKHMLTPERCRMHHGLLLLRAARKLRLRTADMIAVLQRTLGDGAADAAVLVAVAKCAEELLCICGLAQVSPFKLLERLGTVGQPGSEAWETLRRDQKEIEEAVSGWRDVLRMQTRSRVSMEEAWDATPLAPWKSQRLALSLGDAAVSEALQETNRQTVGHPLPAGAAGEQRVTKFSKAAAYRALRMLPDCVMRQQPIQSVPLTPSRDFDKQILPLLPPRIQRLYGPGSRFEGNPLPEWCGFRNLSWEEAPGLLRAAGAVSGVYTIYAVRRNERGELERFTEWYVGSAAALGVRLRHYVPGRGCDPPGPRGEVNKYCLYWAAYQHGWEFQIKYLPLPGLTIQEVREVESHYLQYKWPANKMLNGCFRAQPPRDAKFDRCSKEAAGQLLPRMDAYPQHSAYLRGLARLHVQPAEQEQQAAADAEQEEDDAPAEDAELADLSEDEDMQELEEMTKVDDHGVL
ncbi:hypothetical protein WJX72_007718 [[Myrmecia] bisecta]|uniref:Uncharacterized protein n=1 Tax=[Myrmecia] bisecta TaxID=41462 RepID=A0AAW1PN46_9CHLO